MHTRIPTIALGSVLLFAMGLGAQDDAKVASAIEDLGNEAPAVRARARSALLKLGEPGLEALRRAICVPSDGTSVEQLFVIAEDLGRERRSVHFTQRMDLGEKGWRVAWRPGGKELALLQDHGAIVRILDAELKPTGEQFGDKAAYFAFDPKDGSVAYNEGRTGVVIVERKTGRRLGVPAGEFPILAWSPDGRHIATGGYGLAVAMWSVADGKMVGKFKVAGTEGGLTPVFSPDGKLLVVGNRNDKTHVFDVESGDLLHVLDRASTQQPAFSPDGTLLAIGYVDSKIGIWNVADGTLAKLLDSGTKEVFAVAWSPDGKTFATSGLAGPIEIWSRQHLARLHSIDPGSERTFSLAFRPDGKMLVAAGNQTIRAWTIESKP